MSDVADLPAPDQIEGAPHPRETARLYGHAQAREDFLAAFTSGRLHHGWLITGPRGVGKATLAWQIARFLLATPPDDGGMFAAPSPDTLDIPEQHPVARRIRQGADPGLMVLRRSHDDKGKLRRQIVVDDVRALRDFFGLSAADGGRRVVIVDAADEMNPNAANALLKSLEEPPSRATLLLIAHQPSRLLPTIRSRCRELRLGPLGPEDLRAALQQAGGGADNPGLAQLSGGSVGAAFDLAQSDGAAIYSAIIKVLASLPRMDRNLALALAGSVSGRGTEGRFDLTLTLIDLALARIARAGACGPLPEAVTGEAALAARLCPHPAAARDWAELAQSLGARARQGQAVNIDAGGLILDLLLKIEARARQWL